MEQDWATALKEGSTVEVDIIPNYPGSSLRPDSFKIDYWIDGEKFTKTMANP
jgi:hypothetical protein